MKCDVHAWMNAWVGVVNHPYFAVTGTDGAFSLPNLPPGTYTVEAWHEAGGTADRHGHGRPHRARRRSRFLQGADGMSTHVARTGRRPRRRAVPAAVRAPLGRVATTSR